MKKNNKVIFSGIVIAIILIAAVIVGVCYKAINNNLAGGKSVEQLLAKIDVTEKTPVKGSISLDNTSLYDELPEISKYPLQVEGSGDIVLEIFSSGEKAGSDYESWLIDVAKDFNDSNVTTANGKSVEVSVRQMSSGMGADYIISGKGLFFIRGSS